MAGEIISVGTLVNSVPISTGNVVRPDVTQDDFDEPDRERNSIDVVSHPGVSGQCCVADDPAGPPLLARAMACGDRETT